MKLKADNMSDLRIRTSWEPSSKESDLSDDWIWQQSSDGQEKWNLKLHKTDNVILI